MLSRVLIVEDEQIIAEDLALRVGAMGHNVVGCAISGEEAIALASESKPDLVLMDIRLEGRMTGIEAARLIREKTNAAIIFVTAYPGALLRDVPDLAAREICVHKPWSKAQLEIAINKALAGGFNSPFVRPAGQVMITGPVLRIDSFAVNNSHKPTKRTST